MDNFVKVSTISNQEDTTEHQEDTTEHQKDRTSPTDSTLDEIAQASSEEMAADTPQCETVNRASLPTKGSNPPEDNVTRTLPIPSKRARREAPAAGWRDIWWDLRSVICPSIASGCQWMAAIAIGYLAWVVTMCGHAMVRAAPQLERCGVEMQRLADQYHSSCDAECPKED